MAQASREVWTRRYYIPARAAGGGKEAQHWAEVLLCSTGMFAAVSDFGDYAYAWRSFGRSDFREFVAGAVEDPDYFIRKLSRGERDVDVQATRARIRGLLDDLRSEGRIGSAVRDEQVRRVDEVDFRSEAEVLSWWEHSGLDQHADFMNDVAERIERRPPAMVERFVRETMATLAVVLREELKQERRLAEASA